jgi:hypothetical protein
MVDCPAGRTIIVPSGERTSGKSKTIVGKSLPSYTKPSIQLVRGMVAPVTGCTSAPKIINSILSVSEIVDVAGCVAVACLVETLTCGALGIVLMFKRAEVESGTISVVPCVKMPAGETRQPMSSFRVALPIRRTSTFPPIGNIALVKPPTGSRAQLIVSALPANTA